MTGQEQGIIIGEDEVKLTQQPYACDLFKLRPYFYEKLGKWFVKVCIVLRYWKCFKFLYRQPCSCQGGIVATIHIFKLDYHNKKPNHCYNISNDVSQNLRFI